MKEVELPESTNIEAGICWIEPENRTVWGAETPLTAAFEIAKNN